MVEAHVKGRVELVPDLVGAVLTRLGHVVDQVSGSSALEKGLHILSASLITGEFEVVQLRSGAANVATMELSDNHAANETCEWIKLVEPRSLEPWRLRPGDGHTTEE